MISAGTAYEGLVDRARLQAGETVLVTAASGGVGTAAVQIAKDVGARVAAVASARNHDYVRDLGAEIVVDYHDPDFIEQLRRAVPGGFDVLFDGAGNQVRDQALGLVRRGGRGIFIIGPPPVVPDGVESQPFYATVGSERLDAIARLASGGGLRMPIEAEFPSSELARRWNMSAPGTPEGGSSCGSSRDPQDLRHLIGRLDLGAGGQPRRGHVDRRLPIDAEGRG